ncbi:M20 metallopeptidase family protein [Bacillus sp. 1P06AnD]|uniref:M20 metallopeptidase family protein n=1 Tax=Bacillus sp. 1P06AnD TaxID=3132208 RepID=UPI0039A181AF
MLKTLSINELYQWAVEQRRHLHMNPELSGKEFNTCSFIKQALQTFKIDILDIQEPSVVGFIKGKAGGKTIALRADIDALPIPEEGEKVYKSKVHGVSHACGHDGHTAILLSVARWLSEHREELKHNVALIFQSSEEMIPSGAEILVKQGIMDEVDAVFGLHLFQTIEKGKIGINHGPIMSAADDFNIRIQGKGGHGAMPQDSVDPTYIASHVIQALQSIIGRRMPAAEPAVISIGRMEAGSALNVIPDTATLSGTIRTVSQETRTFVSNEMNKLVEGICTAFGGSGTVEFGWGAPPVVNDKEMSELVERAILHNFGQEAICYVEPNMGSEDFSFYLEEKKGAYFFIGMGGEHSQYPHHHPKFDIDEETIPTAIDMFLEIIKQFE